MRDFHCVFIDTETTGLDPSRDRIVSYALRRWGLVDGAGAATAARVLPPFDPSPEVCAINGYSQAGWLANGARPFGEEHARAILEMLPAGTIVAGSNPRFDVDFLRGEFSSLGLQFPKISHRMIDLNALAAPLLVIGHIEAAGLDALRSYFGMSESRAHSAIGDVDDSIEVWEALLESYLVKP